MSSWQQPDPRPATLAELLALPEDHRVELIDGMLVYKATPSFEHSLVQTRLGGRIDDQFGRPAGDDPPGGWWLGSEAEVLYEAEAHVYRHDLAGWRRTRVPTRPSGRPARVRPDWVCEILSPSNASTDTVSKFRTLQRAGVPWYWLVDPVGGGIQVCGLRESVYSVVATARRGETLRLPPFEAVELDVGVLLGDDPSV